MVQKTKKTAPQEDFRKLEIESVFSTTSSKQHSVPQKELETRVNQIHQVFEGKWQKADIRRALEENEYNVEEVIKLRLEGGDQWTEVKKKPTPQQVRKTKKSSDTAVNTGATRGKSVRGGTARGRGRGGIDRSNGRQANKADDQKVEDTSSLTVIPTDAHDTTSVSQDTDAFFEQPSESAETTPLTSTTTPPTTTTTSSEKTQRVKRDVQQKKRPAVEKLVPSQPPKQEEKMLSYSEVAAIPDNQPQKVEQDDKLKKQKKPKQQKAKPVKQESQASAPQQVVEKQVERLAPQAQLQQPQQPQQPQQQQLPQQVQQPTQQQPQQPQRKEETKKFTATQQPQAENVLSGPFRNVIQFGSLDTDDHADDEPKTLLEQPSAPQISNRRQSQQQQQEVQQQQQLDFGYHGNAGSWGEEQYNQYHAEAVNQFHDPQGFFANYVPQQQQQQQPTQDTGKTTDKDNQNAQATQKQTGYTGYPMHPYTNHMQGYPSYPYGGYPHHPYMLPNQYAQQQYGYGPSQSYAKFGYKGYGAPSSPTYGSNTPPSDDKGAQQHATHSQYGMMQPQYFMMPQYMPDPSLTEKQEPLKSGTTRSPQNVDPSEQHGVPSYYPYGMPYNQYANYVYQPHPHSNLFAHQQGAQTNPSNTQQRGANDSWSS